LIAGRSVSNFSTIELPADQGKSATVDVPLGFPGFATITAFSLDKARCFSMIVTPWRRTPDMVLLPDELALEERMGITHSDSIEVKRIRGKGRGVFARRLIRRGELIEKVPVVVLPIEQVKDRSVVSDYCFTWGRDTVALALGYGSLYNHSYKPNARYDDVGPLTKKFTALRDIQPGEEITVNYNGEPKSQAKVWFEVFEETTGPSNLS
jgi:hypothetical protein